jgi:hypothetical protein
MVLFTYAGPEAQRQRHASVLNLPTDLHSLFVNCMSIKSLPAPFGGEWGYSTRRHMLEPVRPEAVLPDRALCLPTVSHFLIVNKTSLPPSLPPLSLCAPRGGVSRQGVVLTDLQLLCDCQ